MQVRVIYSYIRLSILRLQSLCLQLAKQQVIFYVIADSLSKLIDLQGTDFESRKVLSSIEDEGLFVMHRFEELQPEEHWTETLNVIGEFIAGLVKDISAIAAVRDGSNDLVTDTLHPVMPHQLAAMSRKQFGLVVQDFTERLNFFYTDIETDQIQKEKKSLQDAFRSEPILQAIIEKQSDRKTKFSHAWSGLKDRFPLLYLFCAGQPTVLPGFPVKRQSSRYIFAYKAT